MYISIRILNWGWINWHMQLTNWFQNKEPYSFPKILKWANSNLALHKLKWKNESYQLSEMFN